MTFPRLRLRDEVASLLDLPWEAPLADWSDDRLRFRDLPVGPSRHLVRFLVHGGVVYALKEEPAAVAAREFEALRHLEDAGLPSVRAVGLAQRPERGDAVLVTEYLRHSLQYRRLLMRLRSVTPEYRERLLDAMALLLVDLHRGGVYWGDCSLANTLFRRDGDRIQAYLVDAETSEIHPSLSDGQRGFDLDILVENVAFGLADLAAYQGRDDDWNANLNVWGLGYTYPLSRRTNLYTFVSDTNANDTPTLQVLSGGRIVSPGYTASQITTYRERDRMQFGVGMRHNF
jgi:hypothetical protein